MKIMAGALRDCVHIAGVQHFLALAQGLGHETLFTGPATDAESWAELALSFQPDVIGVSYRLTPENARVALTEFWAIMQAAGLDKCTFIFGGTPPVAEIARELGIFEAVFDGSEPTSDIISYLQGTSPEGAVNRRPPQSVLERIAWKKPYPLLRHHFGIPASSINPTLEGVEQIAQSGMLDVISLGVDQDAQEHFFRSDLQDPKNKGAGGVPVRSESDFKRLYEAAQQGNYPLVRSYSGTRDMIRYADSLVKTINNAWCATSLFWFNAMDGRGPQDLKTSIREHLKLMAWHGERDIPVEGNEPYHWGMRDAPDVISVAASYLYAYNAKKAGVRDYITTYMFESPPMLSNRMDLAKALAQIKVAESFISPDFHIWRQTRTGLLSYPVDPVRARAHLAQSVYLQMALKPSIIHVVGYCEADHAVTASEVIESCTMAQQVIETALAGQPSMLDDPLIQERSEELVSEAMVLINAIRDLSEETTDDPLSDPENLAQAVKTGILDSPQLEKNRFAQGRIRVRAIDGAIRAVDEDNQPITERQRIASIEAE